MKTLYKFAFLFGIFFLFPFIASAAGTTPHIDTGDTAWMMVATALVMLMTIPGLALFYGGLVRRKNILNIFMQSFTIMAVISIEWVTVGYSLSFGTTSGAWAPYIGGFQWAFLRGIHIGDISPYFISHSQPSGEIINGSPVMVGTIPHIVFILFQMMFAVITPALIIGAFAERIKFRGFLIFSVLWSVFIYNPVAHWVWSSDGWLAQMGALDFAGGTVVHINAGIAALVMAVMLGKRHDYKGHAVPPHNIPFVAIGSALLWFGWFGFNAGSGLAADGLAAHAFLVTHIAAAAAAFTWALLDWFIGSKPTLVGVATGAVAGLVAITPAAGFVGISGALTIGVLVSLICFLMVAFVKPGMGYDDTLDAFGVHGMGGIVGALLTGFLAVPLVQNGARGFFYGNTHQLVVQVIAVLATILFSGAGTFVLFHLVDKLFGLRVAPKEEAIGMDEAMHGETAYTAFD